MYLSPSSTDMYVCMHVCMYMYVCVYKQNGMILFRENSNIKSLKLWKKSNLWGFFLCMPVHDLTSSFTADRAVSIIFWKLLYFLRTHLTALLVEQYPNPYNYHTRFVSGGSRNRVPQTTSAPCWVRDWFLRGTFTSGLCGRSTFVVGHWWWTRWSL